LGVYRDECVRLAHADDVPLLLVPEDTCCRRCDCLHGNEPRCRHDGPTKTHALPATREGDRHPVNRGAFHRCDYGQQEGLRLLVTRVGLSLTPPTRYPYGRDNVLFRALQASLVGSTRE
jgi:hypothetical protein